MKLLHYIKEGGVVSTGINIMTNDRNAYANILLRIPLFVRYMLDEFFVWGQDIWYYNIVVSPIWCIRIRLRTWSFVSSSHYKNLWQRVKGMFVCGSRLDHKTIRWEWSQTVEERQDRLGSVFKQ